MSATFFQHKQEERQCVCRGNQAGLGRSKTPIIVQHTCGGCARGGGGGGNRGNRRRHALNGDPHPLLAELVRAGEDEASDVVLVQTENADASAAAGGGGRLAGDWRRRCGLLAPNLLRVEVDTDICPSVRIQKIGKIRI